jgi:hypothetical protein
MQFLLERIDGVLRCLGADVVPGGAFDYSLVTDARLTNIKDDWDKSFEAAMQNGNAERADVCLKHITAINQERMRRMGQQVVAGAGPNDVGHGAAGSGDEGGGRSGSDESQNGRSGSDESVGGPPDEHRKRAAKKLGKRAQPRQLIQPPQPDATTQIYQRILAQSEYVDIDEDSLRAANNGGKTWQFDFYHDTKKVYRYNTQLTLEQISVFLYGLGPKISEYVLVSGICVLCRSCVKNFGALEEIVYAYVVHATPGYTREDKIIQKTINAFLHHLDGEEEQAAMGHQENLDIWQVRPHVQHFVEKVLYLPNNQGNQLQVAFRNYYHQVPKDKSPSTEQTRLLLEAIAVAVRSRQVAEDIFLVGIAAVLRNIVSCLINWGWHNNVNNAERLIGAGLHKAVEEYRKHVKGIQEYLGGYKEMLNAIMHATEYDQRGFFSCYLDRQVNPATGKLDEGRFRSRYGILRWEVLHLFFTFLVFPQRMANDPSFGLAASMEGLGIDDDDDNAVSVQELIERMALGPSALWE